MESDIRREVDAKLDAAQARLAQKIMEHQGETNAIIDAFRLEMARMHQETAEIKVEMRVQFAKIDARFESVQAELKSINHRFTVIQSNFDAKLEKGFANVVKWVIGLVGGAMISFVTVITFVLNHAS